MLSVSFFSVNYYKRERAGKPGSIEASDFTMLIYCLKPKATLHHLAKQCFMSDNCYTYKSPLVI